MKITEKLDIIMDIRRTILAELDASPDIELDDSEFKRNLDEWIDSLISKILETRAYALPDVSYAEKSVWHIKRK